MDSNVDATMIISVLTSSPASSMLPCTTPTAVFFSAERREGGREGGREVGREGGREGGREKQRKREEVEEGRRKIKN